MSDGIVIGASVDGTQQTLELKRANRHGLIAGATGTGKTVTLQGIIEGFSARGVPCFVADVKGDLSGLAMAGSPTAKTHAAFAERAKVIGDTGWAYADNPVQFWDLFGQQGHPIRTTISEMGPLLLARLMDLNEVQEGVLTIAFHVADKEGLLLIDLDDLQAMLTECAGRADELTTTYGNVSKQSIGAIQRSLLQADGSPTPVERTLIKPPASRVGPITPVERKVMIETDAIGAKYDTLVDRESAEELLAAKTEEASAAAAEAKATTVAEKAAAALAKLDAKAAREAERVRVADQREADRAEREAEREAANSPWTKMASSATRAASSSIGRQVANEIGKQVFGTRSRSRSRASGGLVGSVLRGVLGGLFRG